MNLFSLSEFVFSYFEFAPLRQAASPPGPGVAGEVWSVMGQGCHFGVAAARMLSSKSAPESKYSAMTKYMP